MEILDRDIENGRIIVKKIGEGRKRWEKRKVGG
jgi:hypothetical protein